MSRAWSDTARSACCHVLPGVAGGAAGSPPLPIPTATAPPLPPLARQVEQAGGGDDEGAGTSAAGAAAGAAAAAAPGEPAPAKSDEGGAAEPEGPADAEISPVAEEGEHGAGGAAP